MADRVQSLEYNVYLKDKAEAESYQAAYPNGVRIGPERLRDVLLPQHPGISVVLHSITTPFSAPSIQSHYFTATSKYPRNVDEFTICRGGWFGICALFGRTTTYKWVAKYLWVAPPVPEVEGVPVVTPPAIQHVSWADGFERESTVYGAFGGGNVMPIMRGASRHVDGFGFAMRGLEDSGEYVSHTLNENPHIASLERQRSWERFYVRVRKFPTTTVDFYRVFTSSFANAGFDLMMTSAGQIQFVNRTNVGARTVMGTTTATLSLNEWHKIDVLIEFGGGGNGRCRLYKKGVLILDQSVGVGVGLGQNSNHTGSAIGNVAGAATNDLEADFDDWVCRAFPTTLNGLDWLNGDKVVAINPTGFAAGNTWTGDWRGLLRNPGGSSIPGVASGYLSNSTAGSTLRVTTDAEQTVNKQHGSLGVIFLEAAVRGSTVFDSTAAVAYKFGAAAAVSQTHAESNGQSYIDRFVRYAPTGLTAPNTAITPLEIHYTRGAAAGAINVYSFMATACLLGTFGTEDVIEEAVGTVTSEPLPKLGAHNGPYPSTMWARSQMPPTAPVIIVAGTYTGNGTGQDLTFRAPVNFFFSRSVSVNGMEGNWWWSSLHASHHALESNPTHYPMIQAALDTTFVPVGGNNDPEERYVLRIVGGAAALGWNVSGRVYQYIAVMDPGARFHINGTEQHHSITYLNAPVADALKNANFTPTALFLMQESLTGSGTGIAYKGPGNAATGISRPNAAEVASFITLGAGSLTPGANFALPEGQHYGYSAWRTDDNSGDPNAGKVVKIGSYVGNGSGSRTIAWSPTGLRPLWALVVPVTTQHYCFRDPSNTGTTSQTTDGNQNASTGITAGGIDEMTVGTVLNANGVSYNYFVLLGSATAGNNGWSINGEFAQVEPDYNDQAAVSEPPAFVDPDEPAPAPDPDPNPGPGVGDDCDAGAVCVDQTTRIANLALLEIGNSNILTNVCTENTRESRLVLQVYEQCVRHTLISYPWPFATKYAALALTATQPSNADWAYAYRAPSDCIFPRRLVVARGAAADPTPPPIGLSSDDSGGIIFANEASPVLEYTARPACVGYNGDDLFLEALKWRLSAALAPPLTRIAGESDRCMKQFEIIIQKAESTIKPGVPGARPAASTLDTTAPALAANVQVINTALVRIGAKTIANLTTEQSREAITAALVFEGELRSTLRDHPWAFATRYLDPATLVDGAEGDPVNVDWTYAHRLPTDLVMLRRLALEGTGRSFEENPFPFRVSSDATGGLLFSNEAEPLIEYTARLQNIMLFADPVFIDAFAWRLAATMAPSLAEVNPYAPEQHGRGPHAPQDPTRRDATNAVKHARRLNTAQWAWSMYYRTLPRAKAIDMNEQQMEPHPDAEWIRDRE